MKLSERIIEWIKNWFDENGRKTAVLGISGGKDSAVVAGLLVRAIGAENVVGVMMPNGMQSDIEDSKKVVDELKIRSITVNINEGYTGIIDEIETQIGQLSKEAKINTAPRMRMTTLYAVAQTLSDTQDARACVVGTGNAGEAYVGFCTKWGDTGHDINPLRDLWVHEVLQVGDELGYFPEIVHKMPHDGLGLVGDEEKLGVTYNDIYKVATGIEVEDHIKKRVDQLHKYATHKLNPIPYFKK